MAERLLDLAGPRVGFGASVLAIEAASPEEAWGRVVRARTETPLEESRLLARLFDASAEGEVEIVAGGRHAALTDRVLLDAFALARARDLARLRLVHVGPEPISAELEAACAESGATCVHVAWRESRGD